ncbi:Lipase chaperone LimK [Halopseudomonas litoralis]|uniref:Lipase chaperone n=1 Tax=Halopseudomonas litoralis TaxID=797277 RepID=A0A1H1VW80_9GAMM|nr:lipase secretion chaperone [Halopseudomonas litoralis]SDS88289.1 Lipase chaperone LimK [Halopseudomonas litoralis]
MKALIYLPLLGSALLLGWYITMDSGPVTTPPVLSNKNAEPVAPVAQLHQRTESPKPSRPLPASVRGTEVDGQLEVDAAGNLLISNQTRHLFDYFLSLIGEENSTVTHQRIRNHLAQQLSQPALGQALELLESYLDYQQQLAELESHFPVTESLHDLFAREQAVQRLRATLFDRETHAAFFAGEEIYNNFTLERLAIHRDSSLDEQQQALATEALRESLPEEMQQLLVPQIHQDLRQQTRELLAAGADHGEIRQLRMQMLGPEATERLEALDQRRAQWQQRVTSFNQEREVILDQPGLADIDRQAAVNALLEEQFTETERLRLVN